MRESLATIGVLVLSIAVGAGEPCTPIRSIRIETLDVFEGSQKSQFYHGWMQAAHVETRDRIVRRELLFEQGDCLDEAIVAESERNLRAMPILADAQILVTAAPEGEGVDISVITKDRFTLRLELSFSRKGGLNKVRSSLGEKNFLGLGMDLHYSQASRSDGSDIQRFVFRNPRIFKSFAFQAVYSKTDEGIYREYLVEKPFWSLNDRDSLSLHFAGDHTKSDYYRDGGVSLEIPNDNERTTLAWSHEFGSPDRSRRLALEAGYADLSYTDIPELEVPPVTEFPFVEFRFGWDRRQRFLSLTGVDSLRREEDIEDHHAVSVGLRNAWRTREGETQSHQSLLLDWESVDVGGDVALLAGGVNMDARFYAGRLRAMDLDVFGHAYVFLPHRQSLVIGTTYRLQKTVDDLELPLTLGEDMGLRGYDAFSLTGNKTLLVNLEHRWTYPWETQNATWGQVVFVDAGHAWKTGQDVDLADLNWSLGLGLRLDMPSLFGARVLRMDVAHGFQGEGFSVSASVGQIFEHDGINRGFQKDY